MALHMAVRHGHTAVASRLLESLPSSVNACNANGWTPLIYASRWGHFDLALALIQAGADVNAATSDERTPLSVARDGGHTKIMTLLMTAGATESAAAGAACTAQRLCVAAWCASGPRED